METCYPITKPIRSTAPTELQEPVTIAEARKQCGIADGINYHDDELRRLITAARELVENDTGLVCYTGTYTWKLTDWPYESWLEIRAIRPVTSITSITYVDGSGATQTWDSSSYVLETSTVVPLVRLAYSESWPGDIRGDINGITVTMVAGYATVAAIPSRVKQAVLFLVNHWFVNKDTVGIVGPQISLTYEALVNSIGRPSYP